MGKNVTLAQIRKAAPKGVVVTYERDAAAYYADAPHGYHFLEGTHYFAEWHDNYPPFMREAREMLLEKVTDTELEKCPPGCDCGWDDENA